MGKKSRPSSRIRVSSFTRALIALACAGIATGSTVSAVYANQGDCGQPVSNSAQATASDCLFILQVAVGAAVCNPACICAPQNGLPTTATDALFCLNAAVGQPIVPDCQCPATTTSTSTTTGTTTSTSTTTVPGAIIRVHYDAGSGNDMALRGSGGGLSLARGAPCEQSASDLWVCDLGAQNGEIVFKPYLNDTDEARGSDYRLDAPGEIDIFPFFSATTGRVEIIDEFSSTVLGNSRDVAVYLPPSYDENPSKRYPLLVMQDGQDLLDAGTAFGGVEWGVDEAMDAAATTGAIVETIVVAPYSTAERIAEYTPTFDIDLGAGGQGDAYLDFVLDELIPAIQASYRTDSTAVPKLVGSSLGGLISLYGAWTRPSAFSGCAVLSPALYWDDQYVTTTIANTMGDKAPLRIYLDVGDQETEAALTVTLRDVLVSKGWVLAEDLLYVVGSGHGHNATAWALRIPGALAFLLSDPARVAP